MARILRELTDLYRPQCRAKGIALELNASSDVPLVSGDAGQLRQACDAILADAQAVLDTGGRIEVRCAPSSDGVEIVIQDNGPPIPPDDLTRLFEPFRPGRARDGKAIGLALCHGIIRSHGGRIEVESSQASGTRFTIWLPSTATATEQR